MANRLVCVRCSFIPAISTVIALATILTLAPRVDAQNPSQPGDIFSNGPVTLSPGVQNGRGLADLLNQVQQLFLTPITYEEVPYQNASELGTATVAQNGTPSTWAVNPVTDFSVTLTSGDSSAFLATQSVLSAYKNAGRPGVYSVVALNNRVDVVPTQVLGSNGSLQNVKPVMSQQITFPLETRGVGDTLQLITDSLSQSSGYPVVLLTAPYSPYETVELSANGEAARDLISAIGTATNRPLSFQCLYDATTKNYYVNVSAVVPPSAPGGPPMHGFIKPQPKLGPADSPFFTKP